MVNDDRPQWLALALDEHARIQREIDNNLRVVYAVEWYATTRGLPFTKIRPLTDSLYRMRERLFDEQVATLLRITSENIPQYLSAVGEWSRSHKPVADAGGGATFTDERDTAG